jgi:hypothetical protein
VTRSFDAQRGLKDEPDRPGRDQPFGGNLAGDTLVLTGPGILDTSPLADAEPLLRNDFLQHESPIGAPDPMLPGMDHCLDQLGQQIDRRGKEGHPELHPLPNGDVAFAPRLYMQYEGVW